MRAVAYNSSMCLCCGQCPLTVVFTGHSTVTIGQSLLLFTSGVKEHRTVTIGQSLLLVNSGVKDIRLCDSCIWTVTKIDTIAFSRLYGYSDTIGFNCLYAYRRGRHPLQLTPQHRHPQQATQQQPTTKLAWSWARSSRTRPCRGR